MPFKVSRMLQGFYQETVPSRLLMFSIKGMSLYAALVMTSICPAVLGWTVCFSSQSRQITAWPMVPTADFRQHQTDYVQMTRSQLDTRNGGGAVGLCCQHTHDIGLASGCTSLCPFGRYTHRQSNEKWQDPCSITQLNLRPVPVVCSCLWEVLSALTIWPWTCAKLLSSSCIKH